MKRRNGLKNGNKETQFTSENQPSGIAKSKGWERRRLTQEFMSRVFDMQDMTIAEFEKIEMEMKTNKKKYTMRDLMALNYIKKLVNSDKLILDWLDRHIGKVKPEQEEPENPPFTGITIQVTNEHQKWDDNVDYSQSQDKIEK